MENATKIGISVEKSSGLIDRRISVAPMMDWTDRHCRYFLRQFSPQLLLYTEMINAAAILRGDTRKLLQHHTAEHPLALQLGGSDPAALAAAARIAEDAGYIEVNLNCGCPSDKVHAGAFGACLMLTPDVVARCVAAMKRAVRVSVTVKLRIGVIERNLAPSGGAAVDAAQRFDAQDAAALLNFARAVVDAGADALIVHARKAVLGGLSPHENRTVPSLRYDAVAQLKVQMPHVPVIVNGGLRASEEVCAALKIFDGVMIGREAYHRPQLLAEVHAALRGERATMTTGIAQVLEVMRGYAHGEVGQGTPLHAITRHMLGLLSGQPGARALRQVLSQGVQSGGSVDEVFNQAIAIASVAA